jgi:myo-inositol-1(or 4)-monophosphatase
MIKSYLDLAKQVAREAGDYAASVQKKDLTVTTKSNETDLVTQVDKRNEAEIRRAVLEKFPDHAFMGEEMGETTATSGVRWVIDPIDGTVNFAHGLPIWCVSIGIEVNGVVECGVIYNPSLREMFSAERGVGAFLNDKPIHVSTSTNPKQSLYVTGFPYNVDENPGKVIEQFVRFLNEGLLVRRLGSAALDLAYVACGRFDAFWEGFLSPWDTAAGQLLVREAGGRVTHYDGSDYSIHKKSILASNGLQHAMIQDLISEATRNAQ